jgi:hypothetical protein
MDMTRRIVTPGRAKVWHVEEVKVLKAQAARGMDDKVIGDYLGRHHSSVYNKRLRDNIPGKTYTKPKKVGRKYVERNIHKPVIWPHWIRFTNITKDEAFQVRAASGLL